MAAEAHTIPFETTDFVSLQIAAQRIAEAANVAYWLQSYNDGRGSHQLSAIVASFATLAEWVDLLRTTHPHFATQAEAA